MFLEGPDDAEPMAGFAKRRQIWFDSADGAYLAMAAVRRYMDATVVPDVFLVPTERGPALELPSNVVSSRLVQALVWRFGGHIRRAGPDTVVPTADAPAVE